MKGGLFTTILEQLNYLRVDSLKNDLFFYTENVVGHARLSFNQYDSLEIAKSLGADAVYFRRDLYNGKIFPQVYFIDNTNYSKDKNTLGEIHKKIYSSCEVPIYIVIDATSINVYDCRRSVEINDEGVLSSSQALVNKFLFHEIDNAITYYSAELFDNGEFWDSPEAHSKFLYNNSAYEEIIKKLKIIRNEFQHKLGRNNNERVIDELLISCVLIKYLEENGIDEEGNNLAQEFFKKNTGCRTLSEILSNNKLNELFIALDKHFNGGIFQLNNIQKTIISNLEVNKISYLFDNKIDYKRQTLIWKKYSFKHIPVELISSFYEALLGDLRHTDGAVYTPSFLVNHMVFDQLSTLKYNEALNYKIIDTSCGSGIFLVASFKKIIQILKYSNGHKRHAIDKALIKKVLSENIYGVDKDPIAVRLTIFSLSIALCNLLTPKQIWTEIENFSNLSNNIENIDFFDFVATQTPNSFDLVIGNPPFSSDREEYFSIKNSLQKNNIDINFLTLSYEKSFIFFELAFLLARKQTGKVSLVLPAGPFLYFNSSCFFYKNVFTNINVSKIFDLTFLRRKLFTATIPTIVISAVNKLPENDFIEHVVVKRTTTTEQKLFFEIDYYDFYEVNICDAIEKKHIWKCNLLGGGRIHDIVDRITNFNYSLDDFIKDHHIDKKKLSSVDFLNIEDKILIGKTLNSTHKQPFPREVDPRKTSEFIPIYTRSKNLDFQALKSYIYRNADLIRFFIAATSGRQGLRGSYTILDSDLLNFPYLDDVLLFKFSEVETKIINEVVNFKIEEFGKGENARINKQINGGHELRRYLLNYGELYCKVMNIAFNDGKNSFRVEKIYKGVAFYAMEFKYKSEDSEVLIEAINKNSIFHPIPSIESYTSHRVFKIYLKMSIIVIKPKTLRYWLNNIAIRDAEEDMTKFLLET